MSDEIENLVDRMQKDERISLYSELGLIRDFMTPIQYARSIGKRPQTIYHKIRQGKIKSYECLCGGTVIDVVETQKSQEDSTRASGGSEAVSDVQEMD